MRNIRPIPSLAIVAISISFIVTPSTAAEPFRDCPDCPRMVTVPAGSFMMGSSLNDIAAVKNESAPYSYEPADETPQHLVQVKRFSLSVTEVTRDQFDAFVRATGQQAAWPCRVYNRAEGKYMETKTNDWRDPGLEQRGDHPVICVSWNDAKAYAFWLNQKTGKNYRLPSEAEWEYAARAGSPSLRYWDNDKSSACRHANVSDQTRASAFRIDLASAYIFRCRDGFVYTAPVAQFPANAFGLHDMLGNVWEWTEDCYSNTYNGAPADGSAWVLSYCPRRVLRGGSWGDYPWLVRSAYRAGEDPGNASDGINIYVGFRVARTD